MRRIIICTFYLMRLYEVMGHVAHGKMTNTYKIFIRNYQKRGNMKNQET